MTVKDYPPKNARGMEAEKLASGESGPALSLPWAPGGTRVSVVRRGLMQGVEAFIVVLGENFWPVISLLFFFKSRVIGRRRWKYCQS